MSTYLAHKTFGKHAWVNMFSPQETLLGLGILKCSCGAYHLDLTVEPIVLLGSYEEINEALAKALKEFTSNTSVNCFSGLKKFKKCKINLNELLYKIENNKVYADIRVEELGIEWTGILIPKEEL